MTKKIRFTALAVAGVLSLGILAPTAAQASSKGRRNTAIALGAVAVYGLVKKKPLIAGLAGAGAAYSYLESRKEAKRERRNGDRYDYSYRDRDYDRDYDYRDRDRDYDRDYDRGYDDRRSRRDCDDDNYRRDRGYDDYRYEGRGNGKKVGWRGRSMPPGQWKKHNR